MTEPAASEGTRLREEPLDKTNTASPVWADTAYRSKANIVYNMPCFLFLELRSADM
ncbi:hypothetical protein ACI01nite_22610 [Acetobacter cibinongensis]|uniref:Uncharacterized protein n=1 Tax=Acetobacter cibinongensis TaxID=146475 RepID=A0A0D6N7K3_9PROT|nr:hypothetical protein Abci_025_016 [Acetobacter cibinongensis]GBQ14231.1 transposase [Acetobacter cibinongensis NRIC 0482]GEL59659.1 hypothetical protein ACI01nite_22610 [Acetobacter cibinongensis]